MALDERGFTVPELILIAGTRVALGIGIGLLISGKLNRDQRQGAGWALVAAGIMTTAPIVRTIVAKPVIAGRR